MNPKENNLNIEILQHLMERTKLKIDICYYNFTQKHTKLVLLSKIGFPMKPDI